MRDSFAITSIKPNKMFEEYKKLAAQMMGKSVLSLINDGKKEDAFKALEEHIASYVWTSGEIKNFPLDPHKTLKPSTQKKALTAMTNSLITTLEQYTSLPEDFLIEARRRMLLTIDQKATPQNIFGSRDYQKN
jgi:hypothetical protein